MKKYLYSLLVVLMIIISSCSNKDEKLKRYNFIYRVELHGQISYTLDTISYRVTTLEQNFIPKFQLSPKDNNALMEGDFIIANDVRSFSILNQTAQMELIDTLGE